ncbi:MAG: S-adenosylmethionine decarboxylase [Planctomycetia bacterium]|nr:S-adenosylmethionine decarboxylase [Planctomycetia bacterium]
MLTGHEWIIEAEGCESAALSNLATLRALCNEVISDLELRTIGHPHWHQFPAPSGVTGMYLLAESHLTCHTFPEFGLATFNLYCCRPHADWPWQERLTERLGAARVVVRCVPRGGRMVDDDCERLPAASGRGPA